MSKEIRTLRNIVSIINTYENLGSKRARQYVAFGELAGQTDDLDRITRIGQIMDRTVARKERIAQTISGLRTELDTEKASLETSLEQLSELASRHPALKPALDNQETLYHAFLEETQEKPESPLLPEVETGLPETPQEDSKKTTEYSLTLGNGQTVTLRSERAVRIFELLSRGAKNTQELSIELFGEYDQQTVQKIFTGILTLRRNIRFHGYDVVTETTAGDRGQGRKAVYELIELQRVSEIENQTQDAQKQEVTLTPAENTYTEEESRFNNLTDYEAVVIKNALRNKNVINALSGAKIPVLSEKDATQIDEITALGGKNRLTIKARKEIIRKLEVICKEGITDLVFDNSRDAARLLLTYFTELAENQALVLSLLQEYFSEDGGVEGIANQDGWVQNFQKRLTEAQRRALASVKSNCGTLDIGSETQLIAVTAEPTDQPTELIVLPTIEKEIQKAEDQVQEIPTDTAEPTEESVSLTPTPTTAPEKQPRQVIFETTYPNLVRRDSEAFFRINNVVAQVFKELPELMADPTALISPARVTQVFNSVSQTFMSNVEEKRIITPSVVKGRKSYGVFEIATLAYLKYKCSVDHFDSRGIKELKKAIEEEVDRQTTKILSKKLSGRSNGTK